MILDTGIRIAQLRGFEIVGELVLEILERRLPSKHFIEIVPAQQEGFSILYTTESLRHPEIDVLCSRFGLDGFKGPEVERDSMVLEGVVIIVGQHDFGRPKGILAWMQGEPYIEALNGWSLDMLNSAAWPWPNNRKVTGGKPEDLFFEGMECAMSAAGDGKPQLMHHGREGPLDRNYRGLMLDDLSANVGRP